MNNLTCCFIQIRDYLDENHIKARSRSISGMLRLNKTNTCQCKTTPIVLDCSLLPNLHQL